MSFIPRQQYELYHAQIAARRLELARRATAEEKVDRYAEILAVANGAHKPKISVAERAERWRFEKLPIRLKLLAAFKNTSQLKDNLEPRD